ncbi:hypothetical protein HPB50_012858 [Hyalomma asiaticum]|uniref:Uncharacterized protein n=1 Tax=Hyalomma asiaticum TaxID=266040 RepID=A0ACB7TNA9_HYAAI|nr:hypothetical protein HPB50_012858 [Hyalomma asiaticum]
MSTVGCATFVQSIIAFASSTCAGLHVKRKPTHSFALRWGCSKARAEVFQQARSQSACSDGGSSIGGDYSFLGAKVALKTTSAWHSAKLRTAAATAHLAAPGLLGGKEEEGGGGALRAATLAQAAPFAVGFVINRSPTTVGAVFGRADICLRYERPGRVTFATFQKSRIEALSLHKSGLEKSNIRERPPANARASAPDLRDLEKSGRHVTLTSADSSEDSRSPGDSARAVRSRARDVDGPSGQLRRPHARQYRYLEPLQRCRFCYFVARDRYAVAVARKFPNRTVERP